MSDKIQLAIDTLIKRAEDDKRKAQRVAAVVKSGKAKKYIEPAVTMAQGDGLSYWSFVYGGSIHLQVEVTKLEGFKDARLEGILNAFEYLSPEQTTVTEDAGSLRKTIRYQYVIPHDGDRVMVVIEVEAYVKEDSETCKRVVIGYTDGKPQPIYKIDCGDGEPVAEATLPVPDVIDHADDDVLTEQDIGG